MTWLGAFGASFGPHIPPALWAWLKKNIQGRPQGVTGHSGINPRQLASLDLAAQARARDMTFEYRPRKDAFATRLWALRRTDTGNVNKGTLAGWGIDQRDPTTDRRLVEFCLSAPAEQFLSGGISRALARRAFADRVPQAVLNEERRGLQGADWHEGVRTLQARVLEELSRQGDCEPAANTLDLARLRALAEAWPRDGWDTYTAEQAYRIVLLRAVAAGHFLRKATGGNR